MRKRRFLLPIVLALGFASLVLVAASILIGAETLSLARAVSEWRSGAPLADCPTLGILLEQRIPRTLAAFLVGCGLALAGCAFQALLRNPLAEPYTLGVASWGAFGAWTATILVAGYSFPRSLLGIPSVQLAAALFAMADVAAVYAIASAKGKPSPSILLLSGVTLGMLANSGILLVRYFAKPDEVVMMDRWLMGGVDVLGYDPVMALLAGVIPGSIFLLAQASSYDQLAFGTELAAGRGVRVKRLQTLTFLVGSIMTALVVSKVGAIGFVGLIVPHIVRAFVGSRHRILMPLSALVGGAFLCFCDIIARKMLTGETPIGIVTTLLGGPFFLYLLVKRRFANWDT
jgi:iron complex transport system permease protein